MSKVKISMGSLIFSAFLLAAICICGTYYTTKHYVFAQAYAKGVHQNDKKFSSLQSRIFEQRGQIIGLQAENQNLKDKYNELISKVQQYNASLASRSSSVHCTTQDTGYTIFTDCN